MHYVRVTYEHTPFPTMTMPAEPTDEDCRREPYTYRVSARKTCGLLLYPQQSAHKGFESDNCSVLCGREPKTRKTILPPT